MSGQNGATGDVERWLAEARHLIDGGRHLEALALLERAFEAATSASEASLIVGQRAVALFGLGQLDNAIAAAQTGAAVAPDSARPHGSLAILLTEAKRYDDALAEATTALRLRPDDWFLWNIKAIILLAMQRQTEALDGIERAIALEPGEAENWA